MERILKSYTLFIGLLSVIGTTILAQLPPEKKLVSSKPRNKKVRRRKEHYTRSIHKDFGNTPLHVAVVQGDEERAARMLAQDPTLLHKKNKLGETPLHCASLKNHRSMVKLLVDNGADVDAQNNEGQTPLHVAVAGIKLRIERNAESTALNGNQQRYLQEDSGTLVTLIERAADLGICDNRGQTPLHLAAFYGHEGSVTLLLQEYSHALEVQDKRGQTPLHLAAFRGWVSIAELFINYEEIIKNDAAITAQDSEGQTPLHLAINRIFVDEVTNVYVAYDFSERDLFRYSVKVRQLAMIKLLLRSGASTEICNKYGDTPLKLACRIDSNNKWGQDRKNVLQIRHEIITLLESHDRLISPEAIKPLRGLEDSAIVPIQDSSSEVKEKELKQKIKTRKKKKQLQEQKQEQPEDKEQIDQSGQVNDQRNEELLETVLQEDMVTFSNQEVPASSVLLQLPTAREIIEQEMLPTSPVISLLSTEDTSGTTVPSTVALSRKRKKETQLTQQNLSEQLSAKVMDSHEQGRNWLLNKYTQASAIAVALGTTFASYVGYSRFKKWLTEQYQQAKSNLMLVTSDVPAEQDILLVDND